MSKIVNFQAIYNYSAEFEDGEEITPESISKRFNDLIYTGFDGITMYVDTTNIVANSINICDEDGNTIEEIVK